MLLIDALNIKNIGQISKAKFSLAKMKAF